MCNDRMENLLLQPATAPKPPCKCESEIGRLKRIIEIQRQELAAWRTTFDGYTYHPKHGLFSYNGVMGYME